MLNSAYKQSPSSRYAPLFDSDRTDSVSAKSMLPLNAPFQPREYVRIIHTEDRDFPETR